MHDGLSAAQIIAKVAHEGLRPRVPTRCPWASLMTSCWKQDPGTRPDFAAIVSNLSDIYAHVKSDGQDGVDNDSLSRSSSTTGVSRQYLLAQKYDKFPLKTFSAPGQSSTRTSTKRADLSKVFAHNDSEEQSPSASLFGPPQIRSSRDIALNTKSGNGALQGPDRAKSLRQQALENAEMQHRRKISHEEFVKGMKASQARIAARLPGLSMNPVSATNVGEKNVHTPVVLTSPAEIGIPATDPDGLGSGFCDLNDSSKAADGGKHVSVGAIQKESELVSEDNVFISQSPAMLPRIGGREARTITATNNLNTAPKSVQDVNLSFESRNDGEEVGDADDDDDDDDGGYDTT